MHIVTTDGLPAGERLDFWREAGPRNRVPYDPYREPGQEAAFHPRLIVRDLGSIQVTLMTATPYAIHRTCELLRRDDPRLCKLGIVVCGAGTTVQDDDRQAMAGAGDLVLYDTTRPYSVALPADVASGQLLVLRFARSLLPLPDRDLSRVTGRRIPGSHGVGALTSAFLLHLARRVDEHSPADAARLSRLALEMVTMALAHELDVVDSVPRHTRQRTLLTKIHAFIEQNLGDPELGPASIATVHHISLRYLHKLFHAQGRTVAGWIRERRLEHCRRDLAEPLLATRPVSAVAARWGFSGPAHFSQAFRTAYGLSPRQYREQHGQAPAADGMA
ncbi:helix-turn-helix domain-containing protein [Actinomadura sp. 9N215]|uniref:helix-turn-helix domain-containing protein n=1 Tax=Actinomadura sp. 9N215 TaxID=3375150 RepID=UPI0037A8E4DA